MNNETKLKKLMSDLFQIEPSEIDDETSVDSVAKWDSLSHLNLVLGLEETFKVTFTEEQSVEILSYPLILVVLQEHGIAFN